MRQLWLWRLRTQACPIAIGAASRTQGRVLDAIARRPRGAGTTGAQSVSDERVGITTGPGDRPESRVPRLRHGLEKVSLAEEVRVAFSLSESNHVSLQQHVNRRAVASLHAITIKKERATLRGGVRTSAKLARWSPYRHTKKGAPIQRC